jgi:mono/diheme cytochrome c family protein
LTSCSSQSKVNPQALTDRERDGLIGNVKSVLTEDVILMEQAGQWVETQQASSVTMYDAAGARTSQTPFRVNLTGGYAITQHESLFDPMQKNRQTEEKSSGAGTDGANLWLKTYDEKGNLIERTLLNASRAPVSKETVSYEFDARGNWIKRVVKKTSMQAGQSLPQFNEGSYRHIIYFDSAAIVPAQSLAELVPVSAKQQKSPVAATPENIESGRGLFLQKCAACHGEDGKAQTDFAAAMPTRPADLTGQQARALGEGELYSLINDGIKTAGMPAFKGRISDEAIWRIALFVQQLNSAESKSSLTAKPSPQAKTTPEAERRFALAGKVISIERELKQVTVEHEEVKGYMEAMTMPFPMNDEKTLGKLKKGDRIQATLVVGVGFWRLENVVIK